MISLSSILIRIAFLMLAVLGESKQIWYTSYTLGPQHYHYVDKQVSSQNDAMEVCRAINSKIWCPINEKESKLVYENILYHRLEGLIKGTEEISFSNYDNYTITSYLGIRRLCGITEISKEVKDFSCQVEPTESRTWEYSAATGPWFGGHPFSTDYGCVAVGIDMSTEWHSVRCYPMRRYSNAKSSRMYSYVATGTICVSDGIPTSSTPIMIKPLVTDLEASLASVYETVEAAKTLHSMLVVSMAMSAWCCSFCCCCIAPAMYDESDTVGRSP